MRTSIREMTLRQAPRQANVTQYLLDRHLARGRCTHTALIEGDRRVSYQELYRLVQRSAACLSARRVRRGDSVALISHDTVEAVAFLLAAMRLGAVAVCLNAFLPADDYPAYIDCARPRLTLVGRGLARELGPVLAAMYQPWCVLETALETAATITDVAPATLSAGTPAVCLFSSGSTGRPKAVLHSHRDILNTNLNYVPAVTGIREDDITFSPSRLFFAYGLNSLHYALFAGATAVLAPRRSDAETIYSLIERHRPTVLFSVPTVYMLLLRDADDRDLSSLRCCVSAGEALPEDLFAAWRARYGLDIIDGIGTTEVLSTFISNRPDNFRPGSTGRVVPGFEVRLLTDDHRPAGIGELGILWVRGNTVTSGYWRDRAATERCFRDGWFCTNDMFTRDTQGWFHYAGRANEMFKVGGCWVSPVAVEKVVREHPAVQECAVIPRQEKGALVRPHAYVVLQYGIAPCPHLIRAIQDHARTRLPPQHYPHFVDFVAALPKTTTGKLQRYKLRQSTQSCTASIREIS